MSGAGPIPRKACGTELDGQPLASAHWSRAALSRLLALGLGAHIRQHAAGMQQLHLLA